MHPPRCLALTYELVQALNATWNVAFRLIFTE
jgi:hypothetical protein